ncbi:MAG: hypothetical protein KKC96_01980 [Nanoarchaeota archaeon]|nr:hypothetical protein [Nanoarchaeota archaeon]
MEETLNTDKIYKVLVELKREVDFIKNYMVDADSVLTSDENVELDESLKELKEGKAFSLENVKNDRKNA